MPKALGLIGLAILIYFGRGFFESPSSIVDRNLQELIELLEKPKGEKLLKTAQKLSDSLEYFSFPVELRFAGDNGIGRGLTLSNKSQLQEQIAAAKLVYKWLNVSIRDLEIGEEEDLVRSDFAARVEFESSQSQLVYDLYEAQLVWVPCEQFKYCVNSVVLSRTRANQTETR